MDKKEEGLSFKEIFKQNKNEYFRLKHSIYRKNNKEHYRSTQKEWQKNNKKHYDCLHKSAQKAYNIRNKNNKKFIINNVCRKALNLKLREKRT